MAKDTDKTQYQTRQGRREIWVGDENVVNQHFSRLTKLLAEEQRLDRVRYETDFLARKPQEREKRGKALLRLNIQEFRFTPGGQRLVTFAYKNGKPLPRYALGVGDVVRLEGFETKITEKPVGTVYERDRKTITVSFNRFLPTWVGRNSSYNLNVAENLSVYERFFEAIKEVGHASHNSVANLRDISLGLKDPATFDFDEVKKLKTPHVKLNELQTKAVKLALAVPDVLLIHGPPGTGKTSVLVEIIHQAKARGESILATAPSNAACDHIVECLVRAGIPVTRLGHPARVTPSIRSHTLTYKLVNHHLAKLIDKNQARLEQLNKQHDRKIERRGMTWEERREIRDEFKALREDTRKLRAEINQSVWSESDVVVATHAVAGDPVLKTKEFDWVIMDEATQAIEPAAWLAAGRGKKMIFAGDHCQLPPTVFSSKAGEATLKFTLFERLHRKLPASHKIKLTKQYRMNEKIMQFSSDEFYEGELRADKTVKDHTVTELMGVKENEYTRAAMTYVDTAGIGYEEKRDIGTGSIYNEGEAKLVYTHYRKLVESGVSPNYIAIISPYSAQVKLLEQMIVGDVDYLEASKLPEINSVDAFQGREQEVVIVSLVRSNAECEIGFLSDTRRMNVALTRARRKLIVIGDSATISSHPFYEDFLKYSETHNMYESAWEYQT